MNERPVTGDDLVACAENIRRFGGRPKFVMYDPDALIDIGCEWNIAAREAEWKRLGLVARDF